MSESCEILVTEWEGGQDVAGEIILEDGKLSFSATKGYEVLMENVMEGKTFFGETLFDPANDPKAWLRSLPSFYTGSIVRARLVNSQDHDVRCSNYCGKLSHSHAELQHLDKCD
jgi:hypothetical protein